jgi:hypothetical protein
MQQLNVDDVKISLASIRRTLVAVLVIGCSWSSVIFIIASGIRTAITTGTTAITK